MTEQTVKPSEWQELFQWATKLTGWDIPKPILVVLGALVLCTLFIAVVTAILFGVSQIKDIWLEKLVPKAYKPEQRGRATARRQFARYLASEMERVNRAENWRDDEFAELEAEVEAEGRRKSINPFRRRARIRREYSLTRAIRRSDERLILVEGDPGSGKSVSLRHVAYELSGRAIGSKRLDSALPVYVNLKDIKRPANAPIDAALIREAVLSSLTRINDRFIDEFLDREFESGIQQGSWFFVFDSFDEIPDVLSSTANDEIIRSYSGAISDFLSGGNRCRAVVASRSYRGPASLGWTAFKIVPLTPRRQKNLIYKYLVALPQIAESIELDLANASDDVRYMARNPMLLGLLCEHVALGQEFPRGSYEVFSKYIDYRFERDRERVLFRFNLEIQSLREAAETIAFTMTADSGIGLSPSLNAIVDTSRKSSGGPPDDDLRVAVAALSYMRLGRLSEPDGLVGSELFTFSHRRFQEYFATRRVMHGSNPIDPAELLVDGRWRETAVVLLQTSHSSFANRIYEAAGRLLFSEKTPLRDVSADGQFMWRHSDLHILGIIQAGNSGGNARMPLQLQEKIGDLLIEASIGGNLLDMKLALDVAGAAPEKILVRMMIRALEARSQWLGDIVYQQVAKLSAPVDEIYQAIRFNLIRLSLDRRIIREYRSTSAYLRRLPNSAALLDYLELARVSYVLDYMLFPFFLVCVWYITPAYHFSMAFASVGFILSLWITRFKSSIPAVSFASYIRAFTLVIPLGEENMVTLATHSYSVLVGVSLMGLYSSLFWPASLICIAFGLPSRRIFWILGPAAVVFYVCNMALKSWRSVVAPTVVLLGSISLVELLVIAFSKHIIFVMVLLPLLGVAVGLPILLGSASLILLIFRDYSMFRRSLSRLRADSIEEFVPAYTCMRSAWGRMWVLEWVQRNGVEQDSAIWAESLRLILSYEKKRSGWIYEVKPFDREFNRRNRTMEISFGDLKDSLILFFKLPMSGGIDIIFAKGKMLEIRDAIYGLLEVSTRYDRSLEA